VCVTELIYIYSLVQLLIINSCASVQQSWELLAARFKSGRYFSKGGVHRRAQALGFKIMQRDGNIIMHICTHVHVRTHTYIYIRRSNVPAQRLAGAG
jgi:hypothetical protein